MLYLDCLEIESTFDRSLLETVTESGRLSTKNRSEVVSLESAEREVSSFKGKIIKVLEMPTDILA